MKMETHEEILDPYVFKAAGKVNAADALTAMQTAVDQALMWIPIDVDNLPKGCVLCRDTHALWCIGYVREYRNNVWCESDNGLVKVSHYFDPANLKLSTT